MKEKQCVLFSSLIAVWFVSPEVAAHQWLAHLSGQCMALKPPSLKMIYALPPEKGTEKDGWIWKECQLQINESKWSDWESKPADIQNEKQEGKRQRK